MQWAKGCGCGAKIWPRGARQLEEGTSMTFDGMQSVCEKPSMDSSFPGQPGRFGRQEGIRVLWEAAERRQTKQERTGGLLSGTRLHSGRVRNTIRGRAIFTFLHLRLRSRKKVEERILPKPIRPARPSPRC